MGKSSWFTFSVKRSSLILFLSKLLAMMNVFYYYYYLFYTKVIPDNQPHATVIFSLSIIFSLIINGLINIALASTFGVALNRWEMIGILILVIILMYFTFYKNGKGKSIVKEKPKFFKSTSFSILFSLLLFLLSMLFLFFDADITRAILESK